MVWKLTRYLTAIMKDPNCSSLAPQHSVLKVTLYSATERFSVLLKATSLIMMEASIPWDHTHTHTHTL